MAIPAIEARFLDLRYDEIVADPMAQIRKVHARIGRELAPEDEATMVRWLGGNARDACRALFKAASAITETFGGALPAPAFPLVPIRQKRPPARPT